MLVSNHHALGKAQRHSGIVWIGFHDPALNCTRLHSLHSYSPFTKPVKERIMNSNFRIGNVEGFVMAFPKRLAGAAMPSAPLSAAESDMIVPLAVCLLIGLTAALGAVLCFGPGALSLAHVLTTLASAGVAMLTTAVGAVLVADWQADLQGRRVWTSISFDAAGPDIADTATVLNQPDRRNDPYAAVPHDAAVQAILYAHRYAVPWSAPTPEPDAPSADVDCESLPCEPQDSLLHHTTPVAASKPAVETSDNAVSAFAHRVEQPGDADAMVAPMIATIRSKARRQHGVRYATPVRRVVNGAALAPSRTLRVPGIPVRIVSDIVVVGQGENEPSHGDPPHHLLGDSSTKSFAVAEARRRIVALAETLARQAAREDDAAEAAEERSRSPPNAQAEQSPPRRAKDDDTS